MKRPHPHLLAAALAGLVLLAGCATLDDRQRVSELDRQLFAYENALRWNRFEVAAAARRPDPERPPADLSRYADARVTSYRTLSMAVAPDGTRAVVKARIGYYRTGHYAERTVDYVHEWAYDADRRRWELLTGLPELP